MLNLMDCRLIIGMGMIDMVVFDGDEFTESLRKMDEEYEKAILEIVKKYLKKTGQEDLFEEYLEERKKRYG